MANNDSSSSNSGSTISPIDDRMHPYYLHHSESPGFVLVSQLLTGDNYNSWSQAIQIALSVKNKTGFIDGTLLKPNSSDQQNFNAWMRNNKLVISWILNSVSKEISASIMFTESAHEIWKDLKDRFQQSNGPRIFQIRRELVNLKQNQDSIGVYFTKLKSLTEELINFRPHCTCNKCECNGVQEIEQYFQTEHIMNFLMGLHESFTQSRGQILLMDPLPPLNRVFSLIAQEEKQKSVSSDVQHSMAFMTKASNPSRKSPNQSHKSSNRPYCTHCNFQGHTVDKCYKLHGYPPGYKSNNSNNFKPRTKTNHVAAVTANDDPNVQISSINHDLANMFKGFSQDQCQQVMSALSNHMITVNPHEETTTGYEEHEADWQS